MMITTKEKLESIGQKCRNARDGNLLVGSFAAGLLNEDYPFSKKMRDVLFKSYSDEELGRKFVMWCETKAKGERAS